MLVKLAVETSFVLYNKIMPNCFVYVEDGEDPLIAPATPVKLQGYLRRH